MLNMSNKERITTVLLHLLEALCCLAWLSSWHAGHVELSAAFLVLLPFISWSQPCAVVVMNIVRVWKHRPQVDLCHTGHAWYDAVMSLLQSLRDAIAALCLLAMLLQMLTHAVAPLMYIYLALPVVSAFRLLIIVTAYGIERGCFKWPRS